MKAKLLLICASTICLLPLATAWAGTAPILSGKYAANIIETCQAAQSGSNPGFLNGVTIIGNFDNSTGMMSFSGNQTSGDLVVWTGGAAGLTQNGASGNYAYSTTSKTFTLKGVTFNAAYGPLKNGIAQSLVYSGIGYDGSGCLLTGTVIKQ